jgi:hypothetical protein
MIASNSASLTTTVHVAEVKLASNVRRVMHFRGLPPELCNGVDHRELLPVARVLIIEEEAGRADGEPGVLFHRFDEDGLFAGDTWHPSTSDAMDQAEYEYGVLGSEWTTVKDTLVEVVLDSYLANDGVYVSYVGLALTGD